MASKLEKRGPSLGRSRKPSGFGFESMAAAMGRKTERTEAEQNAVIELYASRWAAGVDLYDGVTVIDKFENEGND